MRTIRISAFATSVLLSFALFSQTPDSLDYSYGQEDYYSEQQEEEVYEPSDEEKIIQDESDKAREVLLGTEDIVSFVHYLLDNDSLVVRYAKYDSEDQWVEYIGSNGASDTLLGKLDVIDDKEEGFFYCKEYVFNENKAWDFIYERLYDKNGKLIFFVRQYNTYNSGCAEVAFERSEYYWDENGELIRKTYEIYDSHNQSLDIQDCWMEREVYDKIMDKETFLSIYHFHQSESEEGNNNDSFE